MTGPSDRSLITLRALEGAPLRDEKIRAMIEATATSLAERNGIVIHRLVADDGSITVELGSDRLAALGFAAELRRLTTAWYTRKFGASTLWGEPQARERGEGTSAEWSPDA